MKTEKKWVYKFETEKNCRGIYADNHQKCGEKKGIRYVLGEEFAGSKNEKVLICIGIDPVVFGRLKYVIYNINLDHLHSA